MEPNDEVVMEEPMQAPKFQAKNMMEENLEHEGF